MAVEQYYEKVEGDDSLGNETHDRILRAPPTQSKRKTLLTKVAYLAITATAFLAVVAVISSATVSYRLPEAVKAAVAEANANATSTSAAAAPLMSSGTSSGHAHDSTDSHESKYKLGDADAPLVSLEPEHHQEVISCGGTADEARAAGCVFDVMMQLWTPPQCMDSTLSERYLAKGNWTWWSDVDATKAYSDEEVRKGDHDQVFVAQSYHRHHCIFAWERLVRAMRNQAPLIEELISYDHVMHCRHTTLTLPEEGAPAVRGVIAPTGFTRCASYDVWSKNLPVNKLSSVE